MKQRCAIIVVLFFAWTAAGAKTVALPADQASIDLPDTWIEQPIKTDNSQHPSALILTAFSPEKNSVVQIQAGANPNGMLATQRELVTNTKDALSNLILSHGGQVQFTSESATQINAVPAYGIHYTETTANSKQILSHVYQVAANGKLYVITLRTYNPAADADLQGIANSFRFDSPPVLPVPRAPEHRIRYYIMAGVGVLVVVGLGFGFYYYRQRQLYA